MGLKRGDVYELRLEVPRKPGGEPGDTRVKFLVVLQDTDRLGNARDVTGVLCNTKKPSTRKPRDFEVEVGPAEGFDHETVIDCRFPFALEQSVVSAGRNHGTLSSRVMQEVDIALASGLQMI